MSVLAAQITRRGVLGLGAAVLALGRVKPPKRRVLRFPSPNKYPSPRMYPGG